MPSIGRISLDVHPMDFEEFLWAKGDYLSYGIINEHFTKLKPLRQINKSNDII